MDPTSKVKSNFHQMWKKEKAIIIFLMTGAAIITGLLVPKQHRAFILKKKKNLQRIMWKEENPLSCYVMLTRY